MSDDGREWKDELRRLEASWQFAFAMGHGCSMGPQPKSARDVLQRVDDLRALINEHSHGC